MAALVDTVQQKHQRQSIMLSYLNPGTLQPTATTEDLDGTCSVGQGQPEVTSGSETTLPENHLPGGFEQSSTAETQTLRDFEKHLNDLKKENFSLKLRIYFLEEHIQQKYEASREDVYRRNIELKVEVESLKRELQEKQQILNRAWTAADELSSQNDNEICQQENDHACDILEKKIKQLQEEVKATKTKAERMTTLAEAEKGRCLQLTRQLMEFSKNQDETRKSQALLETYHVSLAEKDKRIEELTWNLRNKEQLLKLLSTEKQNLLQCFNEPQKMDVQNLYEDQKQLFQSDLSLDKQTPELNNTELLEKISCLSVTNKQLQDKLNEISFELKSVQHTSWTQDHKIQNLTETLKNKDNESEELNRVIEGQNEMIAKLREMLHKSQLGQLMNSEGASASQQQQIALCNLQNTLFFTQLEAQRLKRIQQQKDHQLAEAKHTTQFLEAFLQEEQHQKEAAWKHNKELCATLQQLETELQNKNCQFCTLEREKMLEIQKQEQKIKHLNQNLTYREQLLQEAKELLQYHQDREKSPTSADKMVQKLHQRIKDRDAALERAVDEKFCMLEEKEQELQQLRLSVKERECDLEGLHQVLSKNKDTIQDLESLLKAKNLEHEHLFTTYKNLQWVKEEMEAKSHKWRAEQEESSQQLQTALYDRNKEVEALLTTLLCNLLPGQRDIVEELYLRLQQKEQIIEGLLSTRSLQAIEQMAVLQELLKTLNTRKQQHHVVRQESSGKTTTAMIPEKRDIGSNTQKAVLETTAGLEKELFNTREDLELLTRKERESKLELSTLQSVVASQEEELQVRASDIESLTRSNQIKEELIKDLQMQLVVPEEMPAIERLTQQVLMLQEKLARAESQGQEASRSRQLQLTLALEGLAAERNQLNETLKAEKQLYSTLVKFHAHSERSGKEELLQAELETVQALRGQLEEALGRSLEHLSRLESLDSFGDLPGAEDAEDGGTEFTDSIEEEAAQRSYCQQSTMEDVEDKLVSCSICPESDPPSIAKETSLQTEQLPAKCEIQQLLGQKQHLEEELQDLKGQIKEAGFSSISQLRKALLSLCLENAELKEQVGEAMLSEGWENEDEKEDEENLRIQVRKLQEKLHTSETVIGLLKEQLSLSSQNNSMVDPIKHHWFPGSATAQDVKQLQMVKHCHNKDSQWPCSPSNVVSCIPMDSSEETQAGGCSATHGLRQHLMEASQQLPQCKQQCHKLRDKLLFSQATIQAQMVQLAEYQALAGEPTIQRDSKQIQVDLQDLGYETCGRSENEAEREEATSPECDNQTEESETWKKLLGLSPSCVAKQELLQDARQGEDTASLRQQVQALQVQLQSAHKVIRNLQSRVPSVSTTSDYASGNEQQPLKLKQDYTLDSSPSHSLTDEDEGWHSDSFGSLHSNQDLARLIQRVSLLEAHLGEPKPKLTLLEEMKHTASMRKYDSLVQAQARELSHLRKVMREGQGMCRMMSQHFKSTIKSFEELLRGTDIDYFLGQSFREQLAEGNQMAGRLARKLNSSSDLNMEDKSSHELLVLRLSKELQEKEEIIESLQVKLQARSVTPSSTHTISESSRAGSSTSFLSDGLEGCSDIDDITECSSYQEDPDEGQFHSHLKKDLGNLSGKASSQPSHPTSGTTSTAAPSESLQRSLDVLPSQNTLKTPRGVQPDSLSKPPSFPLFPSELGPSTFMPLGPPPPAPVPLLGCCRAAVFPLAEAQQELQMLQKQLGESIKFPVKPQPLGGPFSAGSPPVSSKACLKVCHQVPQPFPMQNSPEWMTKSRAGMGESSSPWHMPPFSQPQEKSAPGILPPSSSATFSSQKFSGADLVEEHLSEIRILRQRLEESICTNDRLKEQLETRLSSGAKSNELEHLQNALRSSHSHSGKVALEQHRVEQQWLQEEIRNKQRDFVHIEDEFLALQINNSRLQDRVMLLQHQCEEDQLLLQALQAELHVYEVLHSVPNQKTTTEAHKQGSLILAEDRNKQGTHVICHLNDYIALKEQIQEAKTLIHKMLSTLHPGMEQKSSSKDFCQEVTRQLLVNASSLHQIMEMSTCLLSLFSRASFPIPQSFAQVQGSVAKMTSVYPACCSQRAILHDLPSFMNHKQEQLMKEEIQVLKTKLAEQESHLQSARHVKENMENFLLTHLTRTYDVLRKARSNLQGMGQLSTPIPSFM